MPDQHLLPHNATQFEKDLSETLGRITDVPIEITKIADIENCPENFLPWLAWAYSVDYWDPALPAADKRALLREAFDIHRFKGTLGALKKALNILNINYDVLEWFEFSGEPYTFRINIYVTPPDDTHGITTEITRTIAENITRFTNQVKNVRSHASIAIGVVFGADMHLLSNFSGQLMLRKTVCTPAFREAVSHIAFASHMTGISIFKKQLCVAPTYRPTSSTLAILANIKSLQIIHLTMEAQ
ncbi:MAG: phage tail protein I [Pseudomonadota bacterium]